MVDMRSWLIMTAALVPFSSNMPSTAWTRDMCRVLFNRLTGAGAVCPEVGGWGGGRGCGGLGVL